MRTKSQTQTIPGGAHPKRPCWTWGYQSTCHILMMKSRWAASLVHWPPWCIDGHIHKVVEVMDQLYDCMNMDAYNMYNCMTMDSWALLTCLPCAVEVPPLRAWCPTNWTKTRIIPWHRCNCTCNSNAACCLSLNPIVLIVHMNVVYIWRLGVFKLKLTTICVRNVGDC